MSEQVAILHAQSLGLRRRVAPGRPLVFGRAPATDVCFPDDRRLSRYAGQLRWGTEGLLIENIGHTHSLFVESSGASAELEPSAESEPAASFVVRSGAVTIAVPWPDSDCRLLVEVLAAPETGPRAVGDAGAAVPTTQVPFRLQPDTKLFATALLLCCSRLATDPLTALATPGIPELTRQLLEVTGSFHLLRQFDEKGNPQRERLTRRVHDQLGELRAKTVHYQMAPSGAKLPPAALADVLVRHRIITKRDLRLLDDHDWQAAQAERWWV